MPSRIENNAIYANVGRNETGTHDPSGRFVFNVTKAIHVVGVQNAAQYDTTNVIYYDAIIDERDRAYVTIIKDDVFHDSFTYNENKVPNEPIGSLNGTEVQFIWGGNGSAEYKYEITDEDDESVFSMECKFPPEKKWNMVMKNKVVVVPYAPAE